MLLTGLTVVEPPLIVYVDAPLGLIVNTSPEQIVPLLTLIVGVVLTEILVTAACVQLLTAVPTAV